MPRHSLVLALVLSLASCSKKPGAPSALERGKAALDSGQYEAAIVLLTRALEEDPGDARAYEARGLAHARLLNNARAVPDFTEALRLEPGRYDSLRGRGIARHGLEEFAPAVEDLTAALRDERGRSDGAVYAYRSLSHYGLGSYREALADSGEAVRLSPQDPAAHLARAMACWGLGDCGQALAHIRRAAALSPAYREMAERMASAPDDALPARRDHRH